ncbi:MAG: methyltransferase domain-containing protein [Anaerolineales bacterium]|nr:methyltransferase domain-containing protein [Anaerolineales bacterium]
MDWHKRYQQQAGWTRNLRDYLFVQANIATARRILEVGCGTGAILRAVESPATLYGIDIDSHALAQCRVNSANAILARGDGLFLPYANASFDIVFCHYFLLWVGDPLQAVREMKRVTRPGGHILALAEPDYLSRTDAPQELTRLGAQQTEALRQQGADPGFGARLAETFFEAGIRIEETGPIQRIEKEMSAAEFELEWAVIESDLAGMVEEAEIQKMKLQDQAARQRNERILHVPTHFAWGRV